MGIASNPQNQNLAQASKFVLNFDRLSDMMFFCTAVNLPGMNMGNAMQQTPFKDDPIPGDKIIYENLNIHFLIDEDLQSWTHIADWMKGVSFPDDFKQYQNLTLQQKLQINNIGNKPQYSDAGLIIYNNKNNPKIIVKFTDVFPVSLSSIEYNSQISAESVLTGTASFLFKGYEINRL